MYVFTPARWLDKKEGDKEIDIYVIVDKPTVPGLPGSYFAYQTIENLHGAKVCGMCCVYMRMHVCWHAYTYLLISILRVIYFRVRISQAKTS